MSIDHQEQDPAAREIVDLALGRVSAGIDEVLAFAGAVLCVPASPSSRRLALRVWTAMHRRGLVSSEVVGDAS